MRTTIKIPASALEVAQRKAPEESAKAEGGPAVSAGLELPVSTLGGGLQPGVRLESNAGLEDLMNGALRPSLR